MGATERDGQTPKGYELDLRRSDPALELKAMVKALKVEDGDLLFVRMPPGLSYSMVRSAGVMLKEVLKDLGVRAAAVTAPSDFDIERIPADKIDGMIELLRKLKKKATRASKHRALELADDVQEET